ncbi:MULTISPECIES: efflux RND transporter periplasmic adaptor subunit [unclassified Ensifer]|uniref:efflux RND transporter periplasmic adaptor subunit n=1 Tax=unclassified Ensifer TaxID=2633371 RepID=UPI0008138485|nr:MULTISPECIES: efflux RND transporter periplasmic adaptor subunit [unclassified Ensifer]OCP06352.1 efflux transporter periplasmic adaptor subunit [Ensifer sp. LC11]OCP09111.1 efflux transporter periplasmic adaptor subunit [Ensifer sp. LC13]OCP09894.1 efflux transporter periplasmic adaptor subunit [Ensifer sp. LC14]OCP31609.1 efflux transporter periplasmic adaptor subunit [Ensifer sp. LC499]
MSSKKAAVLFLASVAAVGGTFALVDGEGTGSFANRLLELASSAGAPEAIAAGTTGMPTPKVPVAEVITREVAPSVEFTGHLEATKAVELRPRVGGAIDVVSVPEGGLVHPADLLFQIDPRPFQVALDAAKGQLRQAMAMLDQAEIDFRRAETLAPNGTVSRKTYDDAEAVRRQRQAQVEIAKAAVAAADLDLSFTRVTAPIGGRVDRVLVTEGNLVSGGNTGAATLLTTIVSTDPLYAYFDIDEATYLEFVARARPDEGDDPTEKLPVQIGVMSDTGYPHSGVLDFIGNRVERGTGTIRARAIVQNPDGLLAPGLFARVNLVTAEPARTVLIDDQAVGTDQGRRYVLALGPGNKAEYRPIELGPMIDGLRVVASGLKPGEKIIVKGLVRPGMEVDPQMISMLPGQSADGDQAAASQEARR